MNHNYNNIKIYNSSRRSVRNETWIVETSYYWALQNHKDIRKWYFTSKYRAFEFYNRHPERYSKPYKE